MPGGYAFSPLRAFLIPKFNGKDRVICAPTVRDRVVQRAIVDFISTGDRCHLRNDVSYGFIPGRSVEKAVERARVLRRSQPWVYKTDITSFFDTISRNVLADRIRRHVRDRSLHSLLLAASECELEPTNPSRTKRIREAGLKAGKGVRQGMPLSPFYANILLWDFDNAIQAKGLKMVRYADDLILFGSSMAECEKIHLVVQYELLQCELAVPSPGQNSKTQIRAPDESVDFLGLRFRPESGDYVLEVSAEQTDKISKRIVEFADFDSLMKAGIDIGSFFRRLDGVIAGYTGAYEFADNASHLDTVLFAARGAAVVRLLQVGLGLSLESMTMEKRRFLGLDL